MSRVPSLSSPFLLGFDEIERALDRVSKAADGYPPYNIERIARENGQPERLRHNRQIQINCVSGFDGGRDRDRTCDPLHVKEVLFR